MGRILFAVLALALWGQMAVAQCRQALALALDVSGSVDAREYRLQLDGLAGALSHPDVRGALLAMPSAPVTLAIYEWSGAQDQRMLLGWTQIMSDAQIDNIAAHLRSTQRVVSTPGTALGETMLFGSDLLRQQSSCWKRTLDISGDGKSNVGPHPRAVSDRLQRGGVTINALVIGADAPKISDARQVDIAEISSYFRAYVIVGPDAFVQTALGFEAFEDAMLRKLLRELQGLALSSR
jgi:Protein of unknown function (DUF1194)